MFELLRKLCAAQGVSGMEKAVSSIILNEIEGYAEFSADRLGNIIVFKKGAARPKTRLMLCAHMDEVGLIVTYIGEEGLLHFAPVGGIDPRVVIGRRVVFQNGTNGVIGTKPVHLQDDDEKKAVPGFEKLCIDIGASSREAALGAVSPGDTVVFDSEYVEFGEGFIKARALDDRAGCAALIELIKSDLPYDCHFAFTVQEEIGARGARAAAYTVQPEAAIVVEATTAADIPFVDDAKKVCSLGMGPVLSFMDHGTLYDRGLFKLALQKSRELGIPSQVKQAVAGGNDAGAIHTTAGGVKTLAVSLPCRYLHSPSCVIRREDAENTLRLLHGLAGAIAGNSLC